MTLGQMDSVRQRTLALKHGASRRRSVRRRRLAVERLESRQLLAVEILSEQWMIVEYELVTNHFYGTDEFNNAPDPDYRATYRGSIQRESGSVTYANQRNGTGSATGSGRYSGTQNYQPGPRDYKPYSCTFDGSANVVLVGTSISRTGVSTNVQCTDEDGSTPYSSNPTGTVDYSALPFRVNMSWSDPYAGGLGLTTGTWNASVMPVSDEDYDIQLTSVEWTDTGDTNGLQIAYTIVGPPRPTANLDAPVAYIKLYWATGTAETDIISGPVDEPIPIYWNQSGGIARVTNLPEAPPAATHLLVFADADSNQVESEETENNLCGVSLGPLRKLEWNTERDREPQAGHRGIDATYHVSDAGLPDGTQLVFHWALGTTLDSSIAEVQKLPLDSEQRSEGKHVVNTKALWGMPPEEATHVLVELRIPEEAADSHADECGTIPNVRALRLHTPLEVFGNLALGYSHGEEVWEVIATFKPGGSKGYTMSEAEVVAGVDHFNWLQDLYYPAYMDLYRNGKLMSVPYRDPDAQVEDLRELILYSPYANGTPDDEDDPTKYERFKSMFVDHAPFYLDEVPVGADPGIEVRKKTTSSALKFYDAPVTPSDFFDPAGDDYLEFVTQLVGVSRSGSPIQLPVDRVFTTFKWKSNSTFARNPGDPEGGGVVFYVKDGVVLDPPTGGQVFGISAGNAVMVPLDAVDDVFRSREAGPFAIDVVANDVLPAGAIVRLESVSTPAHGSVQIDDGGTPDVLLDDRLVYTPEPGFSGEVIIEYTLRRLDLSDFDTARLVVGVGSPTADAGGPYVSPEGGLLVHGTGSLGGGAEPLYFEWDLNGDGLFGDLPEETEEWAFVNPELVDGAPNSTWTVRLRTRDGDDQISPVSTAVIYVYNTKPFVEIVDPPAVNPGGAVTLSGIANDNGGNLDPLLLEWDLDQDGIFGETGADAKRGDEVGDSPVFHAVAPIAGVFQVFFRATDDEGAMSDVASSLIFVNGVNLPPTNISLSNSSVFENLEGGAIGRLFATDPDDVGLFGSDVQTFIALGDRFEIVDDNQLRLAPGQQVDFEAEPSIFVTIRAIDFADNVFEKTLEITVIDTNDPPQRVAGSLGPVQVPRNAPPTSLGLSDLQYQPVETGQSVISYRVAQLPTPEIGEVLLDDGTTPVALDQLLSLAQLRSLRFKPAGLGNGAGEFVIAVRDDGGQVATGNDTAYETVALEVIAAANSPPVLSTIGPRAINVGRELVVVLSATDVDGDTLTYEAASLPPGATFDAPTHTFRWTPAAGSQGSHQPHFVVRDGTSSDFEDVTINVFSTWQATSRPLDVDRDGFVVPQDVLALVNEINVPTIIGSGGRLPAERPQNSTLPFYDVDGDDFLVPTDVVLIINHINAGGGEGEAPGLLPDPTGAETEGEPDQQSSSATATVPFAAEEKTPVLAALLDEIAPDIDRYWRRSRSARSPLPRPLDLQLSPLKDSL